ncbi:MAG TPA: HupE/UreJ family protein [Nannocystaceae bacterium]|nr:HupE/UreJ family protein [Nannocystaceae bacterium]
MPSLAAAHMGSSKSIDAQLTEHGAALRVRVDTIDAALALGLPMDATAGDLGRHEALLRGWLTGGITITSASGPCVATADEIAFVDDGDEPAVTVALDYACPTPLGALTLRDDTVFGDDPDHQTIVAVAGPGGSEPHVLRGGDQGLVLGAVPSTGATMRSFLREGAIHLVGGYDHLLFLLSLVLSAGLLAKARGLGRALRDVAVVVTAFTVGHSLSLAAATLGLVSLPSQLVETAIAGSIVLVALLNIARPEARVARPWIAGVFGLVHGFGFSSVLAEVGLPMGQRALALAAFNVGIELAQLVFVGIVMLPLVWAAGHRSYPRVVVQGGSLAIAICGCVWLVERGFGF